MSARPARATRRTPVQSDDGGHAPPDAPEGVKVNRAQSTLVQGKRKPHPSDVFGPEGPGVTPEREPKQAAAGNDAGKDASVELPDPKRKISAESPSRGLSEKQIHLLTLYGETSLAATRATISGNMDEAKRLKKMALLHSRRFDLDLVLEAAAGVPFTEELAKRLRATNKLVYESEFEIYGIRQSPIHPLVTKAKTQKSTEIRQRHRQLAG